MRLHIAAQAFPTYQGTQAIVRKMLEAEVAAGLRSQLLTYAAAGYVDALSFPVHRPPSLPYVTERSLLRSGPIPVKPLLDLQLLAYLRQRIRILRPEVLIAHHVEAALLGLACEGPPVVFFAHTDLSDELPCYGPDTMARLLSAAGANLDRFLVSRCAATAAISPALRDCFLRHASHVTTVPPPFEQYATSIDLDRARQELRLTCRETVLLYAGNLDAYQGVDGLPAMLVHLASLGHRPTLLLATESDPRRFLEHAQAAGVAGQVRLAGLAGEEQRVRVHAAADLALVPRRTTGGLPIKLLDAMARGVAVVASPAATGGYPLAGACLIAEDTGPRALARQVATILSQPAHKFALADHAQRYLCQTHSPSRYLSSMETITQSVIASAACRSPRTRR